MTIPAGSKYAALAVHTQRVRIEAGDGLEFGEGLHVLGAWPHGVSSHWEKWLGTLKVEELGEANLVFVAHAPATQLDSLNDENEALAYRIQRLYFAFLMAVPYVGHDVGLALGGTYGGDGIDVRSVSEYDRLPVPLGCHGFVADAGTFRLVAELEAALRKIEAEKAYRRLWRVLRAFRAALVADDGGERIHQAVRCIEGFVLPEIGKTRRQFINRGALFLGPGHSELLGKLFDLRSCVEHLHAIHDQPNTTEQDLALSELSYQAEAIARSCLRRLLLSPALWSHFRDDSALAKFWEAPVEDRQALWGNPEDATALFAPFQIRTAKIQLS